MLGTLRLNKEHARKLKLLMGKKQSTLQAVPLASTQIKFISATILDSIQSVKVTERSLVTDASEE
jgi:hypothetical protein